LDISVNLPRIPNFIENCGGSACWGVGAWGLAPLIIIGNKNMRPPLRKLAHKTLSVYVCIQTWKKISSANTSHAQEMSTEACYSDKLIINMKFSFNILIINPTRCTNFSNLFLA